MRPLVFLLCLSSPLLAQEAARTHDVTPDDYFTLNTILEIAVSPDGKQVAYILAVWDKTEDNRKSDLWLIGTDGKGKPAKLTFDRANDRHPKWSADGKHLYFLGNRKREAEKKSPFDGTTQVWRVAADGSGEVKAITREAGGVSGYDYAAKADAVFFSKDKEHADQDEFAKLRAKAKLEYGHGVRKVSEIHKLDVTAWRTEKVVDDTRYVREFAVTQDGKKIAMVSALDDTVVKSEGESRVDVWEAGKTVTPPTDVYRAKAASPYAWLEGLAWNEDGSKFAFNTIFDAHPARIQVFHLRGDKWEANSPLKAPGMGNVRGYGTPIKWKGTKEVWFLGERAGEVQLEHQQMWDGVGRQGIIGNDPRTEDKSVVAAFDFLPDGRIAVVVSERTEFAQLQLYMGKEPVRLVDPNPHTKTWKLPSVKHIGWPRPEPPDQNGIDPVGGVLELPPGYKKGDKLPLVVAIHGGPTTSTKADLSFDPHNGRLYFATAGYAVLLPNYRGSTGYGDKFVTDLIGKENDIEVKDILAGIQHLVKEGIADPDRVGCMGWSNGGYLTNCLITLKDSSIKFKAASSGAGIVDTVAEWGFNDEPAYPIVFKKGLPWEQPELYKKTSPTYQLGNVTTPTFIHVGGGDERCPPGHSRMLYRALKENLKVPTELIVYPGEPHGLTKYSNRKLKMEWDLAWFDKYLKSGKK